MPRAPLRLLVCTAALLVAAGCDTLPQSADMSPEDRAEARLEARSIRTCIGAVQRHTSTSGATHNTDIPVVEVNQYIINVTNGTGPWTCITDDEGTPQYLYKTRVLGG